jgi:hypothetical protein
MKSKSFELRAINLKNGHTGLSLYQYPLNGQAQGEKPRLVVRAWGTPLQAVAGEIINLIKRCGYRADRIKPGHKEPLLLDEETGVRLGLLLLAVKPLSRLDRIEEIKEAVSAMSSEEAYYWYSRCTSGNSRERTCRAFRIMVSKE